ncbi:alpha/beta fold hydrolase [Rhodococcus pyridinivorans]|uniref:flavin-containing monooxygenase n=1 Tax=Rhodococcus pyridinivorans TaxID=103816 RepID=UPI001E5B4B32|nr:alpha/beta hydrolase fold domain-containing protein [Rhodococcus pyridinivorans]MCD5422499.1 alpha/beta fold hydrolase [Rhodococcus pyridinivorans]
MNADHDIVVVGAGFAGLYAVHKMRDELALNVQGFETAAGVGGTWWWNRYPGARCDFESVNYSYSFSEELQREWEWTERFAAQPEILSYLEWVADKLDIRRSFRFNTRVTSVTWDETASLWTVTSDDGASCTARFVVSCVGGFSVPKETEFPGSETFTGELYRTSSWPHEPVDLTGKRVAVIGTGSTGIQVIQEAAKQAAQLTVFQRTANYAAPLRNAAVDPAQRRWNADNHAELRAGSRERFIGAPYDRPNGPAVLATPEERRRIYDKYWTRGGFPLVVSTFTDLLFDQQANDTIADYIRDRIRERVADPTTAELLAPTDHPYASKRPPFETNYYETFNLPHVELVDVRSAPIEAITPTGIRTTADSYDFDVIILATGFDVFTAGILNLGITGRDGVTLDEKWADGPKTYLGLNISGFPNLFTIIGPQSAAALYNVPLAIEDHVDFTAAAIERIRETQARTIEPTPEAEQAWVELTEGILNKTIVPQAKGSWYMGENIPGKPRAAYLFAGGAPLYRAICAQIEGSGYAGFAIDHESRPVPPLLQIDPSAALVLAGMLIQGMKPLEQCNLDEMRALTESLTQMQIPGPDVRVESLEQPRARVYIPDAKESLPVVIFAHGGGWVAGSVDVTDSSCRQLAEQLGAVVVSVDYRLAPEHPFPAAADDTFAAVQWAREHVGKFGGDPHRIVVMGESAGANLAASTALRARDAGIDLTAQVLINPAIDPDARTPSRQEFADGPFLSVAAGEAMWAAYLGGAEVTPLAAPSRAESLSGLAPALVLTVECDPTRDEAEDYARALAAAGVTVHQYRLEGLIHGVFNMSAAVPRAQEFHDLIGEFLAPRFERAVEPA